MDAGSTDLPRAAALPARRPDRAHLAFVQRAVRERALALPLIGALLLLPPLAGVFRIDATLGGWPVKIVALFAIWAALIVAAAALSRPLAKSDQAEREAARARPEPGRDAGAP